MKLTKKFFCPVNGWDCPYWKEDGSCSMVDDGDDPVVECDDAAYFYDDGEDFFKWDAPNNYFVWEDENGNRYDVQELLEKGYHFVNGEPMKPPAPDFIMETLEKVLEHWDEEISFPPDFDEMATNGFRG